MTISTFIILIIIISLNILDLHKHNKRVEEMFPFIDSGRNDKYRIELPIHLYGHYFVLIIVIAMFVRFICGAD